jgi:hypoxanthine phosphoribosyltransferase
MEHHFGGIDGGGHLGEIVISEEELQAKVKELGNRITHDYLGKDPLLVGVLKGAAIFMADMARAIRLPVEFDFMAVSSYGSATKTSGIVRIIKDLSLDIAGRHVIIIEDIIDSGLTQSYLTKNLLAREPASLEICSLIVKKGLQRTESEVKYVGFETAPDFLVGYGLDVAERYRNLPYLCKYVED